MHSRRKFLISFGLIAILLLGVFALAAKRNQRKVVKTTAEIQTEVGIPIQLATVTQGDIADTVEVTGNVSALSTVTLSSKVSGKVQSVAVREGDPVRKGMTIVQLDQSDAMSSMQQAQAGYETALARLSQARTGYSVQVTQSSASIQSARAALDQSEARYKIVKRGARSQEKLIAELAVTQAKANLDNASANLKRYKTLYDRGAIPALQYDQYKTQYEVALADYNTAKQRLSLTEEGSRTEEISAAAAQVEQAREALRMAKANAGQNELRREDINSAKAGVQTALAGIKLAQQQIENNVIKSSINGIVSKRMTEPGQTTNSGTAMLEVVDLNTVYFEASVSETVLSKIARGQKVDVTVDAYPSKVFIGTVNKILPSGSTETRNFVVRITIPNPGLELKPGMFARGRIETGFHTDSILVPVDAVEARQGSNIVFTVHDGKAVKHEVNKGLEDSRYVEVLAPSTLHPGDQVITKGRQSVDDGVKVYQAGALKGDLREQ